MSRFNTLYLGQPDEAADELDDKPADEIELRVALINALRRIHQLEKQVFSLRKDINE